MKKVVKLLMLILFAAGNVDAQDTVNVVSLEKYTFIDWGNNQIVNSPTLSAFFEKLYQLKKTKKGVVNIVHIGDSHIQADFLTHTVRQAIQKEFGNAGRGFVFPGRIARTNEPQSIFSSSGAVWEAKRIVFTDQPLPIGLGASTIRTAQPNAKFMIRTNNFPSLDYGFTKIDIFYKKDFSSFNIVVNDSVNHSLAYVGPYTFENYPNFSSIALPYKAHQVELQTLQPTPFQEQFTLFGMNLSNDLPGVRYHAIGGNGAKFRHYLGASLFVEQTTALEPDLFIISLGTNEAIEYPYIDKQFDEQVETFIARLQQANPKALFMISTPADFFRKRTRRNPGVESVHGKLMKLVDEKKLACWDLYTVGGGKHSADHWKKNGLMQPDGIHATRTGYEVQGTMLYQALMNGYNEYVRFRYP
jgi:lysophospholipase L1-like esterase